MSSTTAGAPAAGFDWLPDSVRAILLVSAGANRRWGGVAAAELAQMVGLVRPHTLLVNTGPGPAGPDRPLDCQTVPGLTSAMLGRHTVREIAVAPPGRSFLFIPAGTPSDPLHELIPLVPFRHLVRAAAKGGTLFLYAAESDVRRVARLPAGAEFGSWFDGIVMLGESDHPTELVGWPPVLARVERPEEARTAVPSPGPSGFTKPKRTPAIVADRASRPAPESAWGRILQRIGRRDVFRGAGGVVAVWLVAIVAVWLIWQGLSGWPAFSDGEDMSPVPASVATGESADPAAVIEREGETLGEAGGRTPQVPDSRVDTAATGAVEGPTGVELAYSVLVGSYLTWSDATQRREELEEDGGLAFVAPTMVRGRLYYRVFAGAFEDREEAETAMRGLVENGLKERERAWDVRPVRLAFTLAWFDTEEEATAARDRLHESGLPAYVLQEAAAPETRFQLHSGAFESEAAAAALDSILEESGSTAILETRTGRTR